MESRDGFSRIMSKNAETITGNRPHALIQQRKTPVHLGTVSIGIPRRTKACTMTDTRIEFPSVGQTYNNQTFGVYEYGTYPRGGDLAGAECRVYLNEFETLELAQAAYPDAVYQDGFLPPSLTQLRDDLDDDVWDETCRLDDGEGGDDFEVERFGDESDLGPM